MKRTLIMTVLLVIALIAIAAPVGAASWEIKVTGGGEATVGGVDFSITASAKQDVNGGVTGQMQYSRSGQSIADLSVHGTVKCIGVFSDGAVAVLAGPTKEQNDPGNQLDPGDWMVVEIKEGGVGSGDKMSVRLKSEAQAKLNCTSPSGSYPGIIYDGNFNIQSNYQEELRYGEITSPAAGAEVSGTVSFTAMLYNDDINDGVEWTVRTGGCGQTIANVIGNVAGMTDPYTFDGHSFSAEADTTDWDLGQYCFVFNPVEIGDEDEVHETRTFTIVDPAAAVFCEVRWKPPINLGNYELNVGAKLPIKFWLEDCDRNPMRGDMAPTLVVNYLGDNQGEGTEDIPPLTLKIGTGGYLYLAHFRTDIPGSYEAIVTYNNTDWVQPFEVVEHGNGNDKHNSEDKQTGKDKDKPPKPETAPQNEKEKDKPQGKPPGKGRKPKKS